MSLVSVLIPAYNAERMISRAIDSALSQNSTDIEILVVDDASTDGTAALVSARASTDERIRLLRREINGGPAATRNVGLQAARGDWIALLDADDMMLPGRIERMLSDASDEDVLVADNLEMYDLHARQVVGLGINPAVISPALRLDAMGFVQRCRTNGRDAMDFGLLKPLVRAAHVRRHRIAYDAHIRHAEDFKFYLDLLLAGGNLLVLPDAYYRYTERFGSLSRRRSEVSATEARYDIVEAQTRALAKQDQYASVRQELCARADALHRLAKIANFSRKSRVAKLASLSTIATDPVLRTHLGQQISARLSRLIPRSRFRSGTSVG